MYKYKFEYFKCLSDMTDFLNKNHIKKENIVKIIDKNHNYSLIYYE